MLTDSQLKKRYLDKNITNIKKKIIGMNYNGEWHNSLEDIFNYILSTNNMYMVVWFVKNIENAPIDRAIEAVIKKNDSRHICQLFLYLFNSNNAILERSEIINIVINTNNAECIYSFVSSAEELSIEEIDRLACAIIKLEDAEYIRRFAVNIKNAPMEKLVDATIKFKNPYYIYEFAIEVGKLLDELIEKLADALIMLSGNTRNIYIVSFASDVFRAPIEKLFNEIAKSNDAYAIYEFAEKVNNLSLEMIDKLADAIIKIGDLGYIFSFAKNIKGAPIEKLADATIKSNDARRIYEFASSVDGLSVATIGKMADVVIKSGDLSYVIDFTMNVDGVPLKKMVDAIIQSNDAGWILAFARKIYWLPVAIIIQLEEAIVKIGDYGYIKNFALDVEKVSIERLADAIIKFGSASIIYDFVIAFNTKLSREVMDKFVNAMIKTGDARYIYQFACLKEIINNQMFNKLHEAIYDSGDVEWIAEIDKYMLRRREKNNFRAEEYVRIIKSGCIAKNICHTSYEFRYDFVNYLYDNIEVGYNEIILKIYYSFLLKTEKVSDGEIDKLDLEFNSHIKSLEKESDNIRHKTRKKRLELYSLLNSVEND